MIGGGVASGGLRRDRSPGPRWSTREPPSTAAAVALTVGGALAVTGIVTLTPLSFAVVRPELRVALETAQALVAFLVAFLVHGGAQRTRRLSDLAMVVGFLLLGGTNLFHAAVHAAYPDLDGAVFARYQAWFPLGLRLVGATMLTGAAWCGERRHRVRRPGLTALSTAALAAAAVATAIAALATRLPDAIIAEGDPSRPRLDAHPGVVVAQLVLVALWAATATGFAKRHARDARPLHLAVAIGAVLAAFSRVNFALYPSLYTDVVHVGDTFRLAFYAVLTMGAASEVVGHWRHEAVSDERERLARELHDGLTQDLAFLRSQLSSMGSGAGAPPMLRHLADAADRALTESRGIVRVLDPGEAAPVEAVLGRAARDVADRAGVRVEVDCDDTIELTGAVVAELARIVREATSNAVRHGGADRVRVRLGLDGDTTVLTVADDGSGFDPGAGRAGYGMRSMRSRAVAVRGEWRMTTAVGHGTTIEVRLR